MNGSTFDLSKKTLDRFISVPENFILVCSERKFYQKITDIYATALDYDVTASVTKRFFATVQNKLHWAIHGQTAAEMVYTRADADKTHMGLTTWKDAPAGKIQKFDLNVAKNYLAENEMAQLQSEFEKYRIVQDHLFESDFDREIRQIEASKKGGKA